MLLRWPLLLSLLWPVSCAATASDWKLHKMTDAAAQTGAVCLVRHPDRAQPHPKFHPTRTTSLLQDRLFHGRSFQRVLPTIRCISRPFSWITRGQSAGSIIVRSLNLSVVGLSGRKSGGILPAQAAGPSGGWDRRLGNLHGGWRMVRQRRKLLPALTDRPWQLYEVPGCDGRR